MPVVRKSCSGTQEGTGSKRRGTPCKKGSSSRPHLSHEKERKILRYIRGGVCEHISLNKKKGKRGEEGESPTLPTEKKGGGIFDVWGDKLGRRREVKVLNPERGGEKSKGGMKRFRT